MKNQQWKSTRGGEGGEGGSGKHLVTAKQPRVSIIIIYLLHIIRCKINCLSNIRILMFVHCVILCEIIYDAYEIFSINFRDNISFVKIIINTTLLRLLTYNYNSTYNFLITRMKEIYTFAY